MGWEIYLQDYFKTPFFKYKTANIKYNNVFFFHNINMYSYDYKQKITRRSYES